MPDRPIRLTDRKEGHHEQQEDEPERVPLSDHHLRLCGEPRALHLRQRLRLQGWVHLREGLRLRLREVATL
jgi:hypothetical protein